VRKVKIRISLLRKLSRSSTAFRHYQVVLVPRSYEVWLKEASTAEGTYYLHLK
jgi:hypothetical protein